jgi:hypothetical protein
MPSQVCVDAVDFDVDSGGRLYQRTHAIKLVNDLANRLVPASEASNQGTPASPDIAIYNYEIPSWDRTAYKYGDSLVYEGGAAGGVRVQRDGVYHLSASYGDDGSPVNLNAMIALYITVDHAEVFGDRTERTLGATHRLTCAGDHILHSGEIVRLQWQITKCDQSQLDCGRADQLLIASGKNHLSIHRIGGLR